MLIFILKAREAILYHCVFVSFAINQSKKNFLFEGIDLFALFYNPVNIYTKLEDLIMK